MAIAKRKRQNFVVQTWNYLPPVAKFGVVAVAGFGIYRVVKNIRDDQKDKAQKKELDKLSTEFNKPFVVTSGANQGTIVHVDLASIATRLHSALNYGLFGMFTDDDTIMRLLLPLPKPYISSLEYIYKKVYGDNLEEKLRKGMWRLNFGQIEYLFL